jgi:hypothetical protein
LTLDQHRPFEGRGRVALLIRAGPVRDPARRSPGSGSGKYEIAFIHAGRGEKDQALEWLEKAYGGQDAVHDRGASV